jgi:O-antigen/teichoic acid export membrane protein
VVATVVSLVFVLATFERRVGRRLRLAPGWLRGDLKEMAGSLVGQHFITITAMLAAYLLPVLVVARLDAAHASYFYATWMICAVFFMISPAVSTSLFADAVANPARAASSAVRAGWLVLALLAAPMALYLVGGGLLLRLFGPEYAAEGRWLIVLLTISAIPDAVTNIAVGVLRATRRIATAFWLNASMLVACLAASWVLLPEYGIAAVGIAWLAVQTAGALWVLATWRRIAHPVVETVSA